MISHAYLKKTTSSAIFITIFISLSICIVIIGLLFYRYEACEIRTQKQRELSTIADLKLHQIKQWRNERIYDAKSLIHNPLLISHIYKWCSPKLYPQEREMVLLWMNQHINYHQYRSMSLFDTSGRQIASVPFDSVVFDTDKIIHLVSEAKTTHTPCMTDIFKDDIHHTLHIALSVPIVSQTAYHSTVLGIFIFDIDPSDFLYNEILKWPTLNKSSEILLVRKEHDSILFLNELRYKKNSALNFKLPLSSKQIPATSAAAQYPGIIEGIDYQGVPTIAASRQVEETAWNMVAKIDKSEMYKSLQTVFIIVITAILLLICITGLIIIALYRHKTSLHYRQLYLSEQEETKLSLALQYSEQKYSNLFNSMHEGVTINKIIYEQGVATDYEILDVNPMFEKMFNVSKTIIMHAPSNKTSVIPVATVIDAVNKALKLNTIQSFEHFEPVFKKHIILSLVICSPDVFALFFFDITERKRMEMALFQEKEHLSVTLRSIGDAVISTDTDGRIVLMNKIAEQLTGWTFTEAQGKYLSDILVIMNAKTRLPSDNPAEKVLKTGQICTMAHNTILIDRHGTELLISDIGAPIKDSLGNIQGAVIAFRDATDKTRADEHLIKIQRLESLGVLAGGIAHDFNNMLCGLFGYIDMAREFSKNDEKVHSVLTKSLGIFNRAKDLTQQLLTFSKGGAPIKKTGTLGPILKDMTQFSLSGSNVECEFFINSDLWLCEFDTNQLSQVIDNIVTNAKQAMPSGGKISVKAKNIELDDSTRYPLQPGRYLLITIQDRGIGISNQYLPKVFDPFFTTKQKCSGLGLTTCYSIIQKHNGFIDIESVLGKGTTVSIFLPASYKTEVEKEPPLSYQQPANGKILFMDDEEFVRDVSTIMLSSMGYKVECASSAEQAIEMVKYSKEKNSPYHCAILDLTIPGGKGGREIVGEIQSLDLDLQIIATSGYSDDPVIANPQGFGFAESIKKPYMKTQLAKVVSKVLTQNST